MNNKIFTYLVCCLGLIIPGCNNEDAVSPTVAQSEQQSILDKASKQGAGSRNGATQIRVSAIIIQVMHATARPRSTPRLGLPRTP